MHFLFGAGILYTMKRAKGGAAVLLLSSNFLSVFGWALLTPLYALYVTQLGASPQTATFIWSFYTLLAGVLMIILGWLEDRIKGKKWVLATGYTAQSLGIGVLVPAPDVRWLVVGLGIYALGTGIVMPIWKVMYARAERKGKEAAGWGFFHGVNTLLISAAAAASGFLYITNGFKGILCVMLVAHLLAVVSVFCIKNPRVVAT